MQRERSGIRLHVLQQKVDDGANVAVQLTKDLRIVVDIVEAHFDQRLHLVRIVRETLAFLNHIHDKKVNGG